ncbi:MAG: quinone-dependent dihydroorotate dehydrogenase [Oscillochloris sp.]|nr:quinone-dependent dihydroorotate dehydrogenase [Oscillochloris sp.]
MLYQRLLRPILFSLWHGDAEQAHERTLGLLAILSRRRALADALRHAYAYSHPALERRLFGIRFPNPLGLAAGMDKDGVAIAAWAALGFGFVELGTVTWYAQPGNPRPRLFRLSQHQALINRMGFNNAGAAALAARLAEPPFPPIPVGISLGKSRLTALEKALDDYRASFRSLFDYGSYFAINVSSPNTPGLRELQDREHLDALLGGLQAENRTQSRARGGKPRPLLLKIAPDLSDDAITEVLQVCAEHAIDGLIAVNTSLSRTGLPGVDPALAAQSGGLSGKPLTTRALEVVRLVARETQGRLPIIGVGGISTPDDALRMLDAGATLLQIYTGLVYEGPGMVGRINRRLAAHNAAFRIQDSEFSKGN